MKVSSQFQKGPYITTACKLINIIERFTAMVTFVSEHNHISNLDHPTNLILHYNTFNTNHYYTTNECFMLLRRSLFTKDSSLTLCVSLLNLSKCNLTHLFNIVVFSSSGPGTMYAKQLEQKSVHIDELHRLLNTYKNQVYARRDVTLLISRDKICFKQKQT